MKLKFDDIHTQKKQILLKEMMTQINKKVSLLPNNNPLLKQCPICSSSVKHYVKAYDFNMSKCTECELIFCNPYPTDEQLEMYYNSEMKAFENEFFRNSFEKRVALFEPRVELLSRYKTNGKLLDIGSAIGIFLEALSRKNSNFEITCCDMSKEACDELNQRYPKFEVINKNFLHLTHNGTYDIITMWDTIEHIVSLDVMLHKVHSLLLDDGLFVFSTPNTHSFEWEIAKEQHVQLLPPGHVNLMNEKNIALLLDKNGFKIEQTYTLNASLDITYIKKLIENDQINETYIGDYLKNKLFDPIFEKMLENYLIETKQAGNIIVIAKKKDA
jgi:2-polyprenyl-3-methyl-5-hydroxy-6-metoxy-1,4-benzoquinol methylase